jgi:hypothetical protein
MNGVSNSPLCGLLQASRQLMLQKGKAVRSPLMHNENSVRKVL